MSDFQLRASVWYTPRGDAGRYIAAKITPGVRASVSAAVQLVAEEARRLVPVDTGALRDSIMHSVRDGNNNVIGSIGAGVSYASYVEYGTGRAGASSAGAGPYPYSPNWPGMPAQPYMRPAIDTAKEAIKEIFRSQVAISLQQ